MAIRNISSQLHNSISSASTRIKNIGRDLGERTTFPYYRNKMIGTDIANVGVFTGGRGGNGIGVGLGGSNVGPNPFSFSGGGFHKGAVQDAATYYTQRRFGSIDSNLGFNRIPGMQRGPRF